MLEEKRDRVRQHTYRVRQHTSDSVNQKIDPIALAQANGHPTCGYGLKNHRIRVIEAPASTAF